VYNKIMCFVLFHILFFIIYYYTYKNFTSLHPLTFFSFKSALFARTDLVSF